MRECFICGRTDWVEMHHIYGGSRRKKSDKYGLVVPLCKWHHTEPPHGAHASKATATLLKMYGQHKFEETHTRAEFMREFGKNYLGDEE